MLRVGDLVNYKSNFGNGIVVKVDGQKARVRFRKFDNYELELDQSSLTLIERSAGPATVSIDNVSALSPENVMGVGSVVEHSKFGIGTITSIDGEIADVAFTDKTRKMSVAYLVLKKREPNNPSKRGYSEEKTAQFQVIPASYSLQSFTSKTKQFLSWMKRHFQNGFASARAPLENTNSSFPTLGLIVVPDKGIAVFKLFETSDEGFLLGMLSSGLLSKTYEKERKDLIDHFSESKSLCVNLDGNNKVLKMPLNYFYIFAGIKPNQTIFDILLRDQQLAKSIFLMGGSNAQRCGFFSNPATYDPAFKTIPIDLFGNIMERVLPENVTLLIGGTASSGGEAKEEDIPPIDGSEKEFVALGLDDEQIRTINRSEPGHYLYLANPGTGKSVLLLSKAYRLVSVKENSHVWVTCFNKNLAKKHLMFSQISGLSRNRLVVRTFYDEIIRLVEDVSKDLIAQFNGLKRNDDKFRRIVLDFLKLFEEGKIQPQFDAILIDEVQLFDPIWLKICHKLLKPGRSFFELYGDLDQDVRSNQSKRKASWQSKELGLDWRGRTHYLTKNYRNSTIINQYLRQMLFSFNRKVDSFGVDPVNMEEVAKKSEAVHEGRYKVRVLRSAPESIAGAVKREIKRMKAQWHADYNDIAVLFPAGGLNAGYKIYSLLDSLLETFSLSGIPSSVIYGENATSLMEANGVIISTIDSALGLDFKYVIVCGTYYWNYFWDKSKTPLDFTASVLNNKNGIHFEAAVSFYIQVGRKIYSACSRARDGLTIIDDGNSASPFKELFCPVDGKDYYDAL